MSDNFKQHLARKILLLLKEQPHDDIAQLRKLAADARARGYTDLAELADSMADDFQLDEIDN